MSVLEDPLSVGLKGRPRKDTKMLFLGGLF